MSANLFPTWVLGSVDLTEYPFSVDRDNSVDIGEPETIVESIQTLEADGDAERVVRYGNRVYKIAFYIEGPTLADVTDSEAVLRRELNRTGLELRHNPGDDFSADSVYEVRTAVLTPGRRDDHEQHFIRQFTLTLTCAPFASSVDLTTVAALAPPPVSPTTATINDATLVTGWTASVVTYVPGDPNPFQSSTVAVTDLGADGISATAYGYTLNLDLTPISPVALTGTPYATLEMSGSIPTSFFVQYPGEFVPAIVVNARAIAGGHIEYALAVDPSRTLQKVSIIREQSSSAQSTMTFNVFDVSRTDTLPQNSPRQLSRIIEVGGTERAPASLHASTISGFLGQTVIHTTPYVGSGYSPDMRRWRSSGNSTSANVDTRKITGTWELMRPNPVVSRTPAHSLPRGDYILMAAVKSDTVGMHAIDYAVKSVTSGQTLGSTEGTYHHYFAVAHEMNLVPLAALAAPVVRSGALDVEVHLLNPSASVALSLEQWWMFTDGDDSALSVVGTSEGNLWLDSPDVNESVPTVWVGPSKAYGYHPGVGLGSQGRHTFRPGQLLVTSISDSNDYLEVEMSYRKRWHSNAAE